MLQIQVDGFMVVDALIECGRLSEAEGLNKAKVEEAVAEIVETWAKERYA